MLSANITTVWNRLCGRRSETRLDTLPTDILIDGIFARLDLKDIMTLRVVSKSFFLLSKQAALWKRMVSRLASLPHPLPTLPPTTSYSLRQMSPISLERLVTQSISLDNNWRKPTPQPFSTVLADAYEEVTEMAMLPGGHYLVTAVKERGTQRAIVVWGLEHEHEKTGAKMAPIPLSMYFVKQKPYGLKAKYMCVNGVNGITVSFITKKHKDPRDPRVVPETLEMGSVLPEHGSPTDPSVNLKYEVETIFLALDVLDTLTKRTFSNDTTRHEVDLNRDSVEVVAQVRTGRPVSGIAMGEVCIGRFGEEDEQRTPVLCVAKRPNTILFEEMVTGRRTVLECPTLPELQDSDYCIMNIQLLPAQRQVLVVREVQDRQPDRDPLYSMELYNIPPFGALPANGRTTRIRHTAENRQYQTYRYRPLQVLFYDHVEKVFNIQISEPDVGYVAQWDPTIRRTYTPRGNNNGGRPPMPVSIYFRTEDGMTHVSVWPLPLDAPMTPPRSPSPLPSTSTSTEGTKKPGQVFFYSLDRTVLKRVPFSRVEGSLRTLPGSHRALVLAVAPRSIVIDPPVLSIHAYLYDGARSVIVGDRLGSDSAGVWGSMKGTEGFGVGIRDLLETQLRLQRQGQDVMMATPADFNTEAIFLDPFGGGEGVLDHEEASIKRALDETTRMDRRPHAPLTPPSQSGGLPLASSSSCSIDDAVWPSERLELSKRRKRLAKVRLHETLMEEMSKGVQACCFDEESGRVVLVTSRNRDWKRKLWIMDFGFGRRTDDMDEKILEDMMDSMDAEEALAPR